MQFTYILYIILAFVILSIIGISIGVFKNKKAIWLISLIVFIIIIGGLCLLFGALCYSLSYNTMG